MEFFKIMIYITPFHFACQSGDLEVVKYLVSLDGSIVKASDQILFNYFKLCFFLIYNFNGV